MKQSLKWFKIFIIIVSVYFIWMIIINEREYSDTKLLTPIPFTIITVYVWRRFMARKTS